MLGQPDLAQLPIEGLELDRAPSDDMWCAAVVTRPCKREATAEVRMVKGRERGRRGAGLLQGCLLVEECPVGAGRDDYQATAGCGPRGEQARVIRREGNSLIDLIGKVDPLAPRCAVGARCQMHGSVGTYIGEPQAPGEL